MYSGIYQVGVCQSFGGNSSILATVVTAPSGGVTSVLGLTFDGTKCAGRQKLAPVPLGNTSTVCGVDGGLYSTVLYSAAGGFAAGSMQA